MNGTGQGHRWPERGPAPLRVDPHAGLAELIAALGDQVIPLPHGRGGLDPLQPGVPGTAGPRPSEHSRAGRRTGGMGVYGEAE